MVSSRHHIPKAQIAVVLILAALIGGLGWTVYAPVRQDRLNRALIIAIKHNDTKKALALLDEGADPNTHDEPAPHLSIWRLLLDKLLGKHPASSDAKTCLQIALTYHQYAIDGPVLPPDAPIVIRTLISKGIDVHAKDTYGMTPLMEAILSADHEHGDEYVEALLNRGAKPDEQFNSNTPLMVAILMGRLHLAQMLLSHHANPNIKGRANKEKPLSLARHHPLASSPAYQQIIQMLKHAGAKE